MNRHRPIYYEIWEIEIESQEKSSAPEGHEAQARAEADSIREELGFLEERGRELRAALTETEKQISTVPPRPGLKEKMNEAFEGMRKNWEDTKE